MTGEAFVKLGTAVLALLGAVITYVVIPYIKSKTGNEKFKTVEFWVTKAVWAAEQVIVESKTGPQKKQYVLEFLRSHGIKLTEAQLDTLIEAAVSEMNLNQY